MAGLDDGQSERVRDRRARRPLFYVRVAKAVFLGPEEAHASEAISHAGGLPGHTAHFGCVRELDFSTVTLASSEVGMFTSTAVVASRSLAKRPPPIELPDFVVHPERTFEYTGDYLDDFDVGEVRVKTQDEKLCVSTSKLDAESTPYNAEFIPLNVDTFLVEVGDQQIRVAFIPVETGQHKYTRTRDSVPIRVQAAVESQGTTLLEPAEHANVLSCIAAR